MTEDYKLNIEPCINVGDEIVMYQDTFRNMFEDHIEYFKRSAKIHEVDKNNAYRFSGDLAAYLNNAGVPLSRVWLIMRLNDMKYNWEFNEDTRYLLEVDLDQLDELLSNHGYIYNNIR